MTDLQRLHEAAAPDELGTQFMRPLAEWGRVSWNAYADGSLIPADRYTALVEAAADVCTVCGWRDCGECKFDAVKDALAALKEVSKP